MVESDRRLVGELAGEVRGLAADVRRVVAVVTPVAVVVDLREPVRPLLGARGLRLLLGFPGFAEQWRRTVPAGYVSVVWALRPRREQRAVACTCGEFAVCELQAVTKCSCERYFMALPDAVAVATFPVEGAA